MSALATFLENFGCIVVESPQGIFIDIEIDPGDTPETKKIIVDMVNEVIPPHLECRLNKCAFKGEVMKGLYSVEIVQVSYV